MHRIYPAAEAEAIDKHTIENIGVPSLVLMERAALTVTKRVLKALKRLDKRQVICVCGKGNNGADGLCVARQLSEKDVNVSIHLVGQESGKASDEKNTVKTDFCTQLDICSKIGIKYISPLKIPEDAIVVDAIFGNGLDREVGGAYAAQIEKINKSGAYVISVDIPSGINATTGQLMGCGVRADETVTFGAERVGHILFPGAEHTGRLNVKNIGWQHAGFKDTKPHYFRLDEDDLSLIPVRKQNSHKGSFGNVVAAAGSKKYGGAAALVGLGAFCSGAGLVRIYTHEDNKEPVLSRLPEAIPEVYDKGDFKPENKTKTLERLSELLKNADSVIAGSGMGNGDEAVEIIATVLKNAKCPLILDADGLNLIAAGKVKLKAKCDTVIITPHIGEAARLLNVTTAEVAHDLVGAAVKLHELYKCIVVLKSARTVIADGKDIYICDAGNPGMAAAGSGDVLAGILGGLAAQGLKGSELAVAGVYLHAAAGGVAKARKGEYAMRASDIAEGIADVI